MVESQQPINWKLLGIIAGILLLLSVILIIILRGGLSFGSSSNTATTSPQLRKINADDDAVTLRSVVMEANVNILADPDFTLPADGILDSKYYTDEVCKSHEGAKLVVTIDDQYCVNAHFLTVDGKIITLDELAAVAGTINLPQE